MRPAGQLGDLIAPADAFDIFAVMFTEYPAILDKEFLLYMTARTNEVILQRDNPGIISECLNLAHFPPLALGPWKISGIGHLISNFKT